MDEVQFEDLKQYIAATVSQTETRLSGELHNLDKKIDAVHQEMAEGFAAVAEVTDRLQTQVDNHEQQLTKLQQKLA